MFASPTHQALYQCEPYKSRGRAQCTCLQQDFAANTSGTLKCQTFVDKRYLRVLTPFTKKGKPCLGEMLFLNAVSCTVTFSAFC